MGETDLAHVDALESARRSLISRVLAFPARSGWALASPS